MTNGVKLSFHSNNMLESEDFLCEILSYRLLIAVGLLCQGGIFESRRVEKYGAIR